VTKEEAVLKLWRVWLSNSRGLDFKEWMDKRGKTEAVKIRDNREESEALNETPDPTDAIRETSKKRS